MFDLYQQSRIRKNSDRVRFAEETGDQRHRRSRDEMDHLHERLDKLLLVTEALWELLAQHTDLTDEDLRARMKDLDALDGSTDGRRQVSASDCSCGAKVNAKAPRCVFCGAPPPARSPFDTI